MGIRSPGEHIGVVAQEVQKVIPEAVSENSKGYLIVNNDPIIWSMLNAIKEQQSLIRTQQARAQTQQKQAQVQQARARAQQAEIDKLKSDLAQQKKQAEVQQTAMTQLLAQVRGIQATLAVDRQDRPNPQVAGTVAHKATKPVVMHSSGQAAPSLVAKVRF
jgi:multidrug efflux pump subunit AcrA (membrane-fusion protein)